MRQQYHFRSIGPDTHIWDVNKLLTQLHSLPVEDVPLDAIQELNEAYWYDLDGDTPTCSSIAAHMTLVQEADLSYPILLCPAGNVIDGMHRVVKALLLKQHSIRAIRLATLPPPDFVNVSPDELSYDD